MLMVRRATGRLRKREEIARLGDLRTVPSMPVEAFVRRGDRKVISPANRPYT
jgi:hypothetical protein